jgi:hypothetical protein
MMLIRFECKFCEGEGCLSCGNRGFNLVGADPELIFGGLRGRWTIGDSGYMKVLKNEDADHE